MFASYRFALSCFILGALLYPLLEIAWRGYTHFAMAIAGGCSCFLLGWLNQLWPDAHRVVRAALGMLCILLVEFLFGVICNLFLHMRIWDYSTRPYNILGQVCLTYAGLWFFLAYVFSLFFDGVWKKLRAM